MKSKGLLILLGVVVILGFWGCNGYNGLVTADQDVKKVWANVETNYQRRTDLYSSTALIVCFYIAPYFFNFYVITCQTIVAIAPTATQE